MPSAREIHQPRQIAALASPARQEIVDAVEAGGPCSVGQIAELLGRRQDGLYYHVRHLLKVGLLVEVDKRPTARRDEAVYDVAARPMQIRYEPKQARNAAEVTRVVASMLRLAHRSFAEAMRRGDARVRGPLRNLRAARLKAWLTEEDTREINNHVRAIWTIARRGRRPGAALHSITFVVTPEHAASRRRTPKGGS
ncbi:MAG: helix-turn-helix transcriptional regulator [Phycisphaerales bacterium]|nr:helix-turn-helix transcriptional regulator [Phycisphaerales bacterium]